MARAHFMKLQGYDKDGDPEGATVYLRAEDVRRVEPIAPLQDGKIHRCHVTFDHRYAHVTMVLHEKATSFVTRVEKQIAALAEQHHPENDDTTTAPPSNEPPTD
ncbi:MAG: hypothetical protein F4X11_03135 [Acidobacteria bacterium]|nr:hypothetical protein [Acidobacteriota bacterium]